MVWGVVGGIEMNPLNGLLGSTCVNNMYMLARPPNDAHLRGEKGSKY